MNESNTGPAAGLPIVPGSNPRNADLQKTRSRETTILPHFSGDDS